MKIKEVSRSFHSHGDRNDESKRDRLLQLLKELMLTHPSIVRVNRDLVSNGSLDVSLCRSIIDELSNKTDRRSTRAKQVAIRLLRLYGHEHRSI